MKDSKMKGKSTSEMQILFFDRRIHFLQDGVTDKNTTFSSSYYCSDFLPKQIIIKELVL